MRAKELQNACITTALACLEAIGRAQAANSTHALELAKATKELVETAKALDPLIPKDTPNFSLTKAKEAAMAKVRAAATTLPEVSTEDLT